MPSEATEAHGVCTVHCRYVEVHMRMHRALRSHFFFKESYCRYRLPLDAACA